jgi:hypothetical protein
MTKHRLGASVVLERLPAGFLKGLPKSDQAAIRQIVGKRVRLVGYDDAGRAELEFVDRNRTYHFIFVDPSFIRTVGRPKLTHYPLRRKR